MEPGYLIDSNVIIGYLAGRLLPSGMKFISEIVDSGIPKISVISEIEVLRFNDTPENEAIMKNFINNSVIYQLTEIIIRRTIQLCKQSKIKLPDAIIAATALEGNFILVTRNIDDFNKITDLKLLNPWDITE